MSTKTVHELYEDQKKEWEAARKLQDDHGKRGADDWSDEHQQQFDAHHSKMTELQGQIDGIEAEEAREAQLRDIEEFGNRETHGDNTTRGEMQANRDGRVPGMSTEEMRTAALCAWMRPAFSNERQRLAAQKLGFDYNPGEITVRAFPESDDAGLTDCQIPEMNGGIRYGIKRYFEERQQATTPGSAGGFTVPEGMMQPIEIALLQFGAPRRYSSIVRAGNGRTIPWPTTNDTGNLGERLAENAASNQQDIVFGQVQTTPELYSSKRVLVSIQLMQDSNENMNALVGRLLGERIGRIQSDEFTTLAGDGAANGPAGLFGGVANKSAVDSTVTLTTANTPTYAELMQLKHSVDPAYRMMGQGWVFPDLVLSGIKQIETNNGPLWRPGLAAGVPDTIDGDPYFVNQSMATGSSAQSIGYGQLDKYKIHDATDMVFRRLDELYAANHQVGFLAFMRSNGLLLDAGTNPVKYASNPA